MSRVHEREWLHQFPGGIAEWGDCAFLFDPEESNYDWLVVYDDLPPQAGERRSQRTEDLRCAAQNTLLVTTEPSSIKAYGKAYLNQFAWVLTTQEEWAIQHPGVIRSQPALRWFYGVGKDHTRSFDEILGQTLTKDQRLSAVSSNKRQKHTLHNRRFQFVWDLKEIPVFNHMDVFGRGVRAMDDKAEALDNYQFHITIENFQGPHHWTEKLADAYLGETVPLYYGCPNIGDYFPQNSYLEIDIFDVETSVEKISAFMERHSYASLRDSVLEAKRRVMYEYNLFAVIDKLVKEHHVAVKSHSPSTRIHSRKHINRKDWLHVLGHGFEKIRHRYYSRK